MVDRVKIKFQKQHAFLSGQGKEIKGVSGENREPSYAAGGNVDWCSNYGEQYGGSLKN